MQFDKIKTVKDKDTWLATTNTPPIYGVGVTEQEALDDYNESLAELKEDLKESSMLELSVYWQMIKEKFESG